MFVDEKKQGELAPVVEDRILSILIAGRERIKARWIKGHYSSTDDCGVVGYCASGAVRYDGAANRIFDKSALRPVFEYLGGDECSLIQWNDKWQRTQSEVIERFDQAIELRKADLRREQCS